MNAELLIIWAGAITGPALGYAVAGWVLRRENRREAVKTLATLQEGCTRRPDAEFYNRKRTPTNCQCAAILGIAVKDEDCPSITSNGEIK